MYNAESVAAPGRAYCLISEDNVETLLQTTHYVQPRRHIGLKTPVFSVIP